MVINICDHVGRCYSNEDGKVIQDILRHHLQNNVVVTISFKNIDGVTSSFVNTAFIELLNDFNFDDIKRLLRFVDSTKQINDMIRNRFMFEVSRRKNLIPV
ncbi:STAS-like domain-containing protein [Siminovitchia sp. FSL W7-1587]|uniref:STAS-like domain-containing protein n=1 Tax=Siminovitchia sp. FSL W7-1587 TaxID=2954699 RepID=UPI0030CD228E